jgi:hypothetical protein
MKRFHGKAATLALLLAFGGGACLGTSLFPKPEIGRPSTDPPGSEGCVGRNLYVNTDGAVTGRFFAHELQFRRQASRRHFLASTA